ncbi:MAG TPA: CAP domain-containing protein [Candidatus Dormibacteraeota bacterium]|nr:CAP domain-containing protein [Candidatus Dormibacteraeota bacterium]
MKNSAARFIAAVGLLPRRKTPGFFRRIAKNFVACLAAALALFTGGPAKAQSRALQRNESERELFELLNHERTANNLPELNWDDALFKAARQHALHMLDLNIMEHQLPNEPGLEERLTTAGARFTYIAENIAIGKDSATIHNGWMHSPGHRSNILSARVTAVGIAVVRGTGGLYAVEDFSQSFGNVSLEQQEKQVASLLTAKGLHVSGASESARKSCDGLARLPGAHAASVIRFETGDLSEFAPELEKKIQSEPYHNVAVVACHTKEAAGFARYRIALVFF